MNLADKIIKASTLKPYRYDYTRRMAVGLAEEIRTAQRFVMSVDTRDAVKLLLTGRPTVLRAACRFARPPFDKVWLEWPTPNQPEPKAEIRVKTTAVGALLTAHPDGAWSFYTAWSYETGDVEGRWLRATGDPELARAVANEEPVGLGVSAMEVGFDFVKSGVYDRDNWHKPPPSRRDDFPRMRNDNANGIRYAMKSDDEADAVLDIEASVRWRVRRTREALEMLQTSEMFGKAGYEAAMDDVRDEVGPVVAMLIMLNSKNCVSLQRVESPPLPEKLVKARLRRKQPLPYQPLSHSVVNISLSRTQQNAATAAGMDRAQARLHLVRGHFKTRKSGVFWWPSHLRGSALAGVIDHDHYQVKP